MKVKGSARAKEAIFVLGPTATGKTEVGLGLAKKLGGEIISCDSMQLYRGMDILTQAPGREMVEKVRHHLVRSLSPKEEYSAARFASDAERIAKDLLSKGKSPVFVGGTGLYVKAFLDGLLSAPPKSEEVRARLREEASRAGSGTLHERLKRIDPKSARKVHPNDLKRVIRALEIYELTGQTKHELSEKTKGRTWRPDICRMFALEIPREVLYERIERRVDMMLKSGVAEEVERLRRCGMGRTASKALGVKELSAYLDGEISLEEAASQLKKNTRNYAKRQITWFKGDKRIDWVDVSGGSAQAADIIYAKIKKKT